MVGHWWSALCTLYVVHKFIKKCSQCQVNLGEGWSDIGVVPFVSAVSAWLNLEKFDQTLCAMHKLVFAGSSSATLEKGGLVLICCT